MHTSTWQLGLQCFYQQRFGIHVLHPTFINKSHYELYYICVIHGKFFVQEESTFISIFLIFMVFLYEDKLFFCFSVNNIQSRKNDPIFTNVPTIKRLESKCR